MSGLSMFIPLTKVDAAQRLVYGIATAETEDRSGEVYDYLTSKPHYEKWSSDIHTASNGLSKGNVRAQHGKIAAGKLTDIHFNDEAKQIEVCAKIVDDAEWKKVEEGVYTGFSQGGSYAKRWTDDSGKKRYTASPSEISLVDLPCLPSARFEMIKADGTHEDRGFVTVVTAVTNHDVVARAEVLAKDAGNEAAWADYLDRARDEFSKNMVAPIAPMVDEPADVTETFEKAESVTEQPAQETPTFDNGVEQVWKAKDGRTFHKKADAIAHNTRVDAEVIAKSAAGPMLDTLATLSADLGIEKPVAKAAGPDAMSDGSLSIKSKDDLGVVLKAVGEAADKNAAKRHIRRRAKALDAVDMLPSDWSVLPAAEKAAEGGLKKDASFYAVSNLISLLAQLEAAENGLEASGSPYSYYDLTPSSTGTRIVVSKETTDAFGAMLGQFGDLTATVLDEILSQMKATEAAEAVSVARSAAVDGLEKAGRRHSAADQSKIQTMHDHAVELGAACVVAKADVSSGLAKGMDAVLEKMREERDAGLAKFDALQKVMADDVMPMLKAIKDKAEADKADADKVRDELVAIKKMVGDQPVPLPLIGRAVSKNDVDDKAVDGEDIVKKLASLPPEEQARVMIKAAQQRPIRMAG